MTITPALRVALARWTHRNHVALHTDRVVWCAAEPCPNPAYAGNYCRRHISAATLRAREGAA